MKAPINSSKKILITLMLAALSASPAWAVFPFDLSTNTPSSGTPTITGGSWAGNGTIQPGITPGDFNLAPPAVILVQDFSSGSFTINGLDGTLYAADRLQGTFATNPVNAVHTINVTGGTADLRLHNSNANDGAQFLFNSVGLTDISATVTSITWTITYSGPIAGRTSSISSNTTRPMGGGLAMLTGGNALADFTVNMIYDQIFHDLGAGFVSGAPAGAAPKVNPGFGSPAAGTSSFTSSTFNAFNEFLLVRGYNVGGPAGYDATDADNVYIRQMTWTITPDAGQSFNPATIFVMSMDGAQYSNFNTVPEPTTTVLSTLSFIGLCFYRRRV